MKRNKTDKKLYMNCPKCLHNTQVIKHGTRKGVQRYLCKRCNKTFNEPTHTKIKYERNVKRVLSLLLNLLENNFFNEKDLSNALQATDKTKELSVKVVFNNHFAEENKNKLTCQISCSNPKLLICQDEKDITFIQLPTFDINQCNKTHAEMLNGKTDRTIKIIDNKILWEYNKHYNKPYIK